jgi:predicted Na+-dependent transporter
MIGRLTYFKNPEAAINLQKAYTPILSDFNLVAEIYLRIRIQFPELDQTDTNILFAACVYKMYSPASLLAARTANAPANMRKAIAYILGYKNGTNINYFASMARSYVKNARYVAKIDQITETFKSPNHA